MLTKTTLATSTPEAQGIASPAILAFLDALEAAELEFHSMILVRHGQTVARGWWSPYATELPHMLFSLSKSFTATAVGMAVAEGRLKVSDRVVKFFPDDLPAEVSANLAAMTVHDLLSMNTGHDTDTTGYLHEAPDGNWARAFLARPVEHKPGSYFVYNTGATYMLSAIVQKLTGQTLMQYLTPRLFEPLGIEGATWESCPRGINTGGYGLSVKTDAIANFGQLYLQNGNWQGQQLVTPEWVAAASAKQVRNDLNGTQTNPDWTQGYGYQFWRCRNGAYRGDGAFGQYCVVMPDQDAVLAITSGVRNMQTVLDLVWEHLLPAMQEGPLPANPESQARLSERMASLSLHPQSGAATSPLASQVSGKRYLVTETNEEGIKAIQLDFTADGATLTLEDEQGKHHIPCGYQSWRAGTTRLRPRPNAKGHLPTAASGAWIDDETYVARIAYVETPFTPNLTFHFVEDRVGYQRTNNVGFGPVEEMERPLVVGHAG